MRHIWGKISEVSSTNCIMNIPQTRIVPDQPSAVPPVYCRSIEITNFRCFKGQVKICLVDEKGLPAQWTVILGENGVGKTSILQCIAGGSVFPDSIPSQEESKNQLVLKPLWADQQWLEWLMSKRANEDQAFQCKLELQRGALLTEACENRHEWFYGLETKSLKDRLEIKSTMVAALSSDMAGFQIYGYGAGRRMALTSRVAFGPNPNDALRSLFDDMPLTNAEEWILELDHLAKTEHSEQDRANRALSNVKDLLKRVLPDITDISTRVVASRRPNDAPRMRVKFHHSSGPLLGMDDLSFGYQTMASWLVDLTRRLYIRYPESSNPLAEPAIVLVDEIDLHLHPKWQQSVMDYLSKIFVNTQFIVTAHSPLIIQSSRASNIVLLRRDGDRVIPVQDLELVRQWRVDQILTSDLFGLDGAREASVEKIFDERFEILAKEVLTPEDEVRLDELNHLIQEIPSAGTKEMRDVEALLRKVAAEHAARANV